MCGTKEFSLGVIISTYNNPEWLEKTLRGYMEQDIPADEIIIADDGSGDDSCRLIERYSALLPIKHIWHEDQGFRKTVILNKAILAAESDYLVFTDQDCVPRRDFLATHVRYAEEGYFLSGGYFKLPMSISKSLSREDIASGRMVRLDWLRQQGLKWNFKCTKLIPYKWFSVIMNIITPANASWNGMNSSGWREDILKVNGFDERMEYGGEDREMGERLFNMGIRSKQIRYSAIVLHLDHSRPYKNQQALIINKTIRDETRKKHIIQTSYGIKS